MKDFKCYGKLVHWSVGLCKHAENRNPGLESVIRDKRVSHDRFNNSAGRCNVRTVFYVINNHCIYARSCFTLRFDSACNFLLHREIPKKRVESKPVMLDFNITCLSILHHNPAFIVTPISKLYHDLDSGSILLDRYFCNLHNSMGKAKKILFR
ncbi:unnamed protein product [Clavelina lepadiformis]|uniref:Uncharacterized protein n=1 Tax=Clavelina lepadiformis TaxID=159417 RepID=A0ABP0GM98_CLALP